VFHNFNNTPLETNFARAIHNFCSGIISLLTVNKCDCQQIYPKKSNPPRAKHGLTTSLNIKMEWHTRTSMSKLGQFGICFLNWGRLILKSREDGKKHH
jgi:hypothetical protein